jgi:hypothetical protein
MRRFNKLEEAILKMVHKHSKLDNTIGVTWDEYGNPIPILNDEQDIIESNVIENDDTTGI